MSRLRQSVQHRVDNNFEGTELEKIQAAKMYFGDLANSYSVHQGALDKRDKFIEMAWKDAPGLEKYENVHKNTALFSFGAIGSLGGSALLFGSGASPLVSSIALAISLGVTAYSVALHATDSKMLSARQEARGIEVEHFNKAIPSQQSVNDYST